MKSLIQVLVLTCLYAVYAHENVEVSTPSGRMLGTTLTSRLGKTIYSFRGIRFAEPPVNDLRFKPPIPTGRWNEVYNATVEGPNCPQPVIRPISEDCLFLNVYSPKFPKRGSNVKKPVIVFLHPGGFYVYTGHSDWFGPQYLLDQDVVLVTVNYRLASLGFLSVGKEVSGNNGLKDQVVALKWIKKHISAFGGDPDNITLYGYSAGSWSIQLHMVSPMSRGLFHKAILGSGSVLGEWPLPRNQLDIAKKQAQVLDCPDNNVREIIKCLKTKSAEELGNSFWDFAEFGYNPVLRWSPVIEEDHGQERFLLENPINLYLEGKFQQFPVMAGQTKDEFANMAIPIVSNATLLQQLDNEWEKYAPICFIYERGTLKSKEVSKAIRKFYLGDGPLTNASLPGLSKIFTDSIESFPISRGVNLISEKCSKAVYYYQFTYQGRYSHYTVPETDKPYGVTHHDDLIYSFYIKPLFPFFNQSYPEAKIVEKYTTLLANFAKTGNPIPAPNAKLDNIEWKPYNKNTKKYMEIGEKLVLKENLLEDRLLLWRRLYPLSLYN